jgi:ABC-type transport system substrate-binding protein
MGKLQQWALVAALVLVAACAAPPGSIESSQGDDLSGGVLRVGWWENPNLLVSASLLDPQVSYSEDWEIFRCCLARTLVAFNGRPADEGGLVPRPDLATELPTVSDDRMTWTFHIRRGVNYAPPLEDVEVTAPDFVRALERTATLPLAQQAGYGFYYSIIDGFDEYSKGDADSIAGLETPDDHTLVVHLREPSVEVDLIFALHATSPLPADPDDPDAPYGVAQGHDEDYGRYLVSSGPYMFEETPPADFGRIALVRNPSWDPREDDLRPAFPDRIELTRASNSKPLLKQFDDGGFDVLFNLDHPLETVARYEEDPSLRDRVVDLPTSGVWYAVMNLAVPPFDDVHVRKAVNHVLDRRRLSTLVTRRGLVTVVPFGHIAPDILEDDLLLDYQPYGSPDGRADVASARGEMARSRYDSNEDGLCDARVCKGITAVATIPNGADVGSMVRDLKKIGLSLRPRVLGLDRYYLNGPYDTKGRWGSAKRALALSNGWADDTRNASNFFEPHFRTENAAIHNTALVGVSPGQLRRWGYEVNRVPSIDSRLEACGAQVGDLQLRCWAELDVYLMEKVVAFAPLFTQRSYRIVSDRVVRYAFDGANLVSPAFDRFVVSEREP